MVKADQVIIGIIWGIIIWPQIREALIEELFCNPSWVQMTMKGFVLFGGSCNFTILCCISSNYHMEIFAIHSKNN